MAIRLVTRKKEASQPFTRRESGRRIFRTNRRTGKETICEEATLAQSPPRSKHLLLLLNNKLQQVRHSPELKDYPFISFVLNGEAEFSTLRTILWGCKKAFQMAFSLRSDETERRGRGNESEERSCLTRELGGGRYNGSNSRWAELPTFTV